MQNEFFIKKKKQKKIVVIIEQKKWEKYLAFDLFGNFEKYSCYTYLYWNFSQRIGCKHSDKDKFEIFSVLFKI